MKSIVLFIFAYEMAQRWNLGIISPHQSPTPNPPQPIHRHPHHQPFPITILTSRSWGMVGNGYMALLVPNRVQNGPNLSTGLDPTPPQFLTPQPPTTAQWYRIILLVGQLFYFLLDAPLLFIAPENDQIVWCQKAQKSQNNHQQGPFSSQFHNKSITTHKPLHPSADKQQYNVTHFYSRSSLW